MKSLNSDAVEIDAISASGFHKMIDKAELTLLLPFWWMDQGCQMLACFRTKNPVLGKFWRVLYLMDDVGIMWTMWPFGLFYGYLVHCVAI
jgi:hypothetical protein